ncbi:MAG: hypothetical protein JSV66_17750, partial [Trueperaceae bacterium]
GTLSWADGDTSSKSFDIAIIDDGDQESNEGFQVSLTNATNGASIGTGTSGVTITDNDQPPVPGTLALSSAAYTFDEGVGDAGITVTRSGGSDGAVSVTFYTRSGGAKAGKDYTATTVTVSWADGESGVKTVNIPIIDDVLDEVNEAFWAKLRNVSGGASLGANSSLVTITDND